MQLPPWVIRYQRLLLVLCFLAALALVFMLSGLRSDLSGRMHLVRRDVCFGALAGRGCTARVAQPLGAQGLGAAGSAACAQRVGGAHVVSNPACAELRFGHVGHPFSRLRRGHSARADFAFDAVLCVF
jgi:hypothetical protein